MTERSTAKRRFLLAAVGIPVAVTAIGAALQATALDELPDPIAIHWGPNGSPDGYAAPLTSLMISVVMGLGLPTLVTSLGLPGLRGRHHPGPTHRMLASTSAASTTFVVTLTSWLTLMQRGLASGTDAPAVWGPLAGALAIGAAAGLLAWMVQPRPETPSDTTRHVAPLPLHEGQRVAWFHEASLPLPWALVGALVSTALLVASGIAWLVGDLGAAIAFSLATAITAGAVASTTFFRVRADRDGLTVRSATGLPRFHIPLSDIASVGVIEINGLGEYGGFGLRWMPGRVGVILRSGEALEVVRHSGKRLAITVDDAATGAAVLEALLPKSRHP